MAASEDDIRGLRRFGESRQPLSDLVDADARFPASRNHAQKGSFHGAQRFYSLREDKRKDHSLRYRSRRSGSWKTVGVLTALLRTAAPCRFRKEQST